MMSPNPTSAGIPHSSEEQVRIATEALREWMAGR